jgi:hypothetical protein
VAAQIRLDLFDVTNSRPLTLSVPAADVISTALIVSAAESEVPTLASVERIVGRLSSMALVLDAESELSRIASMVNSQFLPVRPSEWNDAHLSLDVNLTRGDDVRTLSAIAALRNPTLLASDEIMMAEQRHDVIARREQETALVDTICGAVRADREIWERRAMAAGLFVGKTVLSVLITQLVGIPLADIVRTAVKGFGSRA